MILSSGLVMALIVSPAIVEFEDLDFERYVRGHFDITTGCRMPEEF
jgi:hypothetical protein